MRKNIPFFIMLISLFCSQAALADNMLFDANVLYTNPNISNSDTDKFHTGKILNLNINNYFYPWLGITGGVFISEKIFDQTTTDIAGTSQVSFETHGLTLGIRPEHKFSDRNKVYARLGVLVYKTTLEVNEFFQPGMIAGSSSYSTNGTGYLIASGWAHNLTKSILFQLELYRQTQTDLFYGKTQTDKVFDINSFGFTLGLAYAF